MVHQIRNKSRPGYALMIVACALMTAKRIVYMPPTLQTTRASFEPVEPQSNFFSTKTEAVSLSDPQKNQQPTTAKPSVASDPQHSQAPSPGAPFVVFLNVYFAGIKRIAAMTLDALKEQVHQIAWNFICGVLSQPAPHVVLQHLGQQRSLQCNYYDSNMFKIRQHGL